MCKCDVIGQKNDLYMLYNILMLKTNLMQFIESFNGIFWVKNLSIGVISQHYSIDYVQSNDHIFLS